MYKHVASVLASFKLGRRIYASRCTDAVSCHWTTQRDADAVSYVNACVCLPLSPPLYTSRPTWLLLHALSA